MRIEQIIEIAKNRGCSDIHLSEGLPLAFRVCGRLEPAGIELTREEQRELILSMIDESQKARLEAGEDLDFSMGEAAKGRQRVNIFRQQGCLAATLRLLNNHIPTLEELGLPPVLRQLAEEPRGLVLITGPTGSGKSTTLAAMVDYINATRASHIVTIEDPVEYIYQQKRSIIHQREVGRDTASFAAALCSVLREDPDVILVGEMRDYETISTAVTAAETGHLVLSTLHTTGAAQTIDRIIDACPAGVQGQVRVQLAGMLKGVVTQCLIPRLDGQGRIAATEILTGTDAVLNMIRENKCFQMGTAMQSGAVYGMHTLNGDLVRLIRKGIITREMAMSFSNDRKELEQYL